MTEICDVYTASGQRAGRTFEHADELQDGEFRLHAIVLLIGKGGKYLLQQRALDACYFPGEWDVTGGGVMTGEDGQQAAIRETMEELGLALDPLRMVHGGTIRQPRHYLFDLWGAKGDFTDADCAIDPAEVNAVRMADWDEFARVISYNKDAAFMALAERIHQLLVALPDSV